MMMMIMMGGVQILIKGLSIASGYYKDPQKTKDAWDDDGWFSTGDVGRFDKEGRLWVVDRKKSMFKLAQGEYVSPEHLESVLLKSPWVRQVWVYGKPSERYVVAVVVPEKKVVMEWGKRNGLDWDFLALCDLKNLKNEILTSLRSEVEAKKLPSFQKPVDVHLEASLDDLQQGFTLDKGMLTPTMKFKRAKMVEIYKDVIEEMYRHSHEGEKR
uniref:AMP-binding enzyme C-terminal domain-containing protein n=1 Tax=Lotharella oceanica TaxID=641309 RepID=A0A7S2TMI9_9EUKA|mmetsp:Transcript_21254/g.39836  ORF Transcript_21254/g.39836 Transcript_21254/m.39836 type:complete len:213 (+) Transcript_21254:2-640(+)